MASKTTLFLFLFSSLPLLLAIAEAREVIEESTTRILSSADGLVMKTFSAVVPKKPAIDPTNANAIKLAFLNEHNKVRLATGLPPLQWDYKLEEYARSYANHRIGDCVMEHSKTPYGENLFWGSPFNMFTAIDAVKAWADEIVDYNPVQNVCRAGKMCGHYTQIVWKNTTHVGCWQVKCYSGGIYIVCSYSPPGNYIGQGPFGDTVPDYLLRKFNFYNGN